MNSRLDSMTENSECRISITDVSADLLRKLFLHHDGIVVGATILALRNGGILDRLYQQKDISMAELRQNHVFNSGYLHVALRCLALQGWIERIGVSASDEMRFRITWLGEQASQAFGLYSRVAEFIYSGIPLEKYLFDPAYQDSENFRLYAGLVDECMHNWPLPKCDDSSVESDLFEMIAHHLDGMLIAPFMIAAKVHGLLEGDHVPLNKMFGSRQNVEVGLQLLQHFGWVTNTGSKWRFTELGKLAGDFSLHYGLTGSYFPMFCNLEKLIFNSSKNVTHVEPGSEEKHVDRVINVLASGVAHRRYFEDSEAIIIDLFNQLPLQNQPKFVADMGCGDGEWLKRIYQVIKAKTKRGQALAKYPLLMIGADYNHAAQTVVRENLDQAGIPNLVIFGDVGDPGLFSEQLKEHDIDIREGLHVRAFIDHNRPYQPPVDAVSCFSSQSTGAYADQDGHAIANHEMEQSLCEHLRKWVPYIHKHGLIILEAHNVNPEVASEHLGRTHATAFDTYHGYSNQYPVDFEAFIEQAENAGLRSVIYRQMLYPSRLPFVAISLNHFKTNLTKPVGVARQLQCSSDSEWIPDGSEDSEDGKALHELLYRGGDISRPTRWCCYSTGLLVSEILLSIESRWDEINTGRVECREITLVDYGVGTGLVTLELIKALEDKGLLELFSHAGVEFRLLVCDFPSGWFAKGYDLMKQYSFVSFFSLKDKISGKIRRLEDIFPQASVDLIFASMVFHLVPPAAFPLLADSFSQVLRRRGVVLWNTPDTPPTLPRSNLIHTGNRLLRKELQQLFDKPSKKDEIIGNVSLNQRDQVEQILDETIALQSALDSRARMDAACRAKKQILPEATDVSAMERAFRQGFDGESWVKLSVITDAELIALALLPANQRNVGEISNRELREKIINVLMTYQVLPKIHQSAAGLPGGMALHWTFGKYRKM